jgi:radical SAM-linked protein
MQEATLSVCGPQDCHGCAPFARECVKGVVAETTGRPLDTALPLLGTRAAPGPGEPARLCDAPPLVPRPAAPSREEREAERRRLAELPRSRYRARFSKSGRITWLGHLDLTRLLLRAMRRARIPLVYTQGFNPKPRVGFAPALAVGVASEAEYLDFESWEPLEPDAALSRINAALPPDVRFLALREIARDAPTLGELIRAARYRATSRNGLRVAAALDAFRQRSGLAVERPRKNGGTKVFELARELLELDQLDDRTLRLTLRLHADGPSLRPDELLALIFGAAADDLRLVREELLAAAPTGGAGQAPALAPPLPPPARAVALPG